MRYLVDERAELKKVEDYPDEHLDKIGERWIGEGTLVRDLPSWEHRSFRCMVATLLKKSSDEEKVKAWQEEQEAIANAEENKRISENLKAIPDPYLFEHNLSYARDAWLGGLSLAGRLAFELRAKGLVDWIYIFGKTGRGKSHLAGMIAEKLARADAGKIAWLNHEELDSCIKYAAGGNDDASRMAYQMVQDAKQASIIIVDDLGKPDTKSDGVSLPHRIQPIHDILEHARLSRPKKLVIATSEHHRDDLGRRLSQGVVSRLFESTEVIEIKEPQRYREWLEVKGEKK